MKTRAAVLRETNADWSVEEIELDGPGPREVLVKTTAAGMCHSDEHARNGAMPVPLPIVGGHEGAGVVVEVGEGVAELAVGDHISASFVPSCGRCRWCADGQQHLCDLGIHLLAPGMLPPAGGFRHHDADGNDLTPMLKLGTFARAHGGQHRLRSEGRPRRTGGHRRTGELRGHNRLRGGGQPGRRPARRHRGGGGLRRARQRGAAGGQAGRGLQPSWPSTRPS